jgi:hypothetical protein
VDTGDWLIGRNLLEYKVILHIPCLKGSKKGKRQGSAVGKLGGKIKCPTCSISVPQAIVDVALLGKVRIIDYDERCKEQRKGGRLLSRIQQELGPIGFLYE